MNSLMKSITGIAILMSLSACVEVKDKDDNQNKVIKIESRNYTIDEPYYLVNGTLVRKRDFAKSAEQNATAQVGDYQQYELHFDHLTMLEGGVIYTMGQYVKFKVEDLESRGGVISTFPDDHSGPENTKGRSGGNLFLNLNHARGDLKVLMIGERGGRGLQGKAPGPFKSGSNLSFGGPGYEGAAGGDSGIAEIVILDDSGFQIDINRQGGPGGHGGEGGRGRCSLLVGSTVCNPDFQAQAGAEGVPGNSQYACVTKGQKSRQCY